ncbi:PaaD-like zinc ribbon domain-containing protein [Thermus scotoductus]|uniref:PaaD-like zinc ribbon domain-containing protein n=1 Tax=Thermus scotoductus TaxID=37636 RepID=UPI000F813B27|nr:PAS domain-containing protein [Thermus scotoductus]RTI28567.1 hypothetical protein CSW22_08160 [Thermus scotoductus]
MNELLAEAWEKALEGLVLHRDGQVLYLNPKAEELLEVSREKVVGRPLLLALRDHRLEALALHGGERTLEVRSRTLRVRALPGRLYLLDETELSRRLEALEEATQALAHELRTPLAGMGPPCPRCGSQEVVLKNTFGATLCKMLYQCAACGEVFEAFKTV